MAKETGRSVILLLLAVGTVGVLLPQMVPSWEWSGVCGWAIASLSYVSALVVAIKQLLESEAKRHDLEI